MGQIWSKVSEKYDEKTTEWVSIDSNAVDKLCEPISVSVKLSPKCFSQISLKRERTYKWSVEFEVDVAHLQRRLNVCSVQTKVADCIEKVWVTTEMLRSMIESNDVSVDEICNICAIHLVLEGDGVKIVDNLCVIVDVSRDSYQECEDIGDLTRRMYGYTNKECEGEA